MLVHGVVKCRDELIVLQTLQRGWGRIGQAIPYGLVGLDPSLAPRMATEPGGRFEDDELARPGREARGPTVGVQLGEHRHERVVRGVNAYVIHILQRASREGRTPARRYATRDANEQRMQPRDCVFAHVALLLEVVQP